MESAEIHAQAVTDAAKPVLRWRPGWIGWIGRDEVWLVERSDGRSKTIVVPRASEADLLAFAVGQR